MNKIQTPLKVLMIAPQPFYEDRGTPIVVLEELKILHQLGCQVDLATYPIGIDINIPGLTIVRAANPMKFRSVAVGFSVRKLLLDILLLLTVLSQLSRKHYNCIHGVEEGAAIAAVCKAIYGIPIIYDMHSSIPDQLIDIKLFRSFLGRKIAMHFEKTLVSSADVIIASAGLADHVLCKAPHKAVWECFFPVADTNFNKVSLSCKLNNRDRPTIVYAGNFSYYQGLDLLIKAAKIIRSERPDIIIILVGGSDFDTQPIRSLVEKYKLEGTIKLHPRVHRTEVYDFLSIADALVLPRRYGKNVPLKLFEFMKSKKPIVATDIPAHTALLNNEMALLVPPNAKALAQGLLRVVQDTEFGNFIAANAYTAALTVNKNSLQKTLSASYRYVLEKFN